MSWPGWSFGAPGAFFGVLERRFSNGANPALRWVTPARSRTIDAFIDAHLGYRRETSNGET